MTRTLTWAVAALLGLATLAACGTSPPPPRPTPSPALGTVSGRYIPCTGLGQHTGLKIDAVADGRVMASTVTDEQGYYRLDLTPGRYDLSVEQSRLASMIVRPGTTTAYSDTWTCG